MRFHDLRHAYATLSLASGDDLPIVSSNLGNASILMTASVYAHVLPRSKKGRAERYERFVMGGERVGLGYDRDA